MPVSKLKFTKRAIEALPTPEAGKRCDYWDSETPGLGLRITSTGNRSFCLFRRIEGKQERITLGRYPGTTVEQARRAAAVLNGKVAAGQNPAADRRAIRAAITLGEMFDEYLERHAKPHKATWEKDQGLYQHHLKHWAGRKLSSLTRLDIQRLHQRIGANATRKTTTDRRGRRQVIRHGGKGAANHVLRLLKTIYSKAIAWGWAGENPVIGVKEYRNTRRDRFLEADELAKLFAALMEEPNETARDFFLLALLTGARRANVLSMRWDQISLERRTWFIPKTKNGDSQTIPIVPVLVDLLDRRRAASCGEDGELLSPFVLPGKGRAGHYANPDAAWKRILKRAGVTDDRGTWIHDLRRSLGSWQAATGANLSVIGKTLNHRNVNTTAIYARLNIDPVRASIEKAANAMLAAGGVQPVAEVVDLKRGRGK